MHSKPASLAMTASCVRFLARLAPYIFILIFYAAHIGGTAHITSCMLHGNALCFRQRKGHMLALHCLRCQKASVGTVACSLAAATASLGINARKSLSFACRSAQHHFEPIQMLCGS